MSFYSGKKIRIKLFADVGLFAIGITNEINEQFLAAISGDVGVTNGQQVLGYDYFKSRDFQVLDSILEMVSDRICKRPESSECNKCPIKVPM